jgi:hypothetical protein
VGQSAPSHFRRGNRILLRKGMNGCHDVSAVNTCEPGFSPSPTGRRPLEQRRYRIEARGDKKAAADCCRKVIELVRAHPDRYEPAFTVTFQQMVDALEPSPAG